MTGSVEYWSVMREIAKKLHSANAADGFISAVLILAEMTSRAMTNMNLTPQQVDQYRGQLSFCYKIAEDARTALTAPAGNANAGDAGGFQNAP